MSENSKLQELLEWAQEKEEYYKKQHKDYGPESLGYMNFNSYIDMQKKYNPSCPNLLPTQMS